MKRLLVLGAGTAGTTLINKLHRRLPAEWEIVVVDQANVHHYQPGYLFVPFGGYQASEIVKPTAKFIPEGVHLIHGEIDSVEPELDMVRLVDGSEIPYDQLVIATGTTPRPDQTPGMLGPQWMDTIHNFYTLDGATALGRKLAGWRQGRLVIHVTEMPIKCPVAPLEFAFLADDYFRHLGARESVEITYVTPLGGAFTKPIASKYLGDMLEVRDIDVESDFYIERVGDGAIVSYDEREIPFDLLVTVPLNMGADFVAKSGLGDELNYVRVDHGTFQSPDWPNIFAIGDAAALPSSKAGSTAHFAVDVFTENFMAHIAGSPMPRRFDGHANCFVESGGGKALLIDFNYDTEPLPGRYPYPVVGPLALLKETRINHLGKLAFKPIYWNLLLRGRPIPVPTEMSMAGKVVPAQPEKEKVNL